MLRARVAPLHAADVGFIVTIVVAKLQLAPDIQQLNQSNQMCIHPDSFLQTICYLLTSRIHQDCRKNQFYLVILNNRLTSSGSALLLQSCH